MSYSRLFEQDSLSSLSELDSEEDYIDVESPFSIQSDENESVSLILSADIHKSLLSGTSALDSQLICSKCHDLVSVSNLKFKAPKGNKQFCGDCISNSPNITKIKLNCDLKNNNDTLILKDGAESEHKEKYSDTNLHGSDTLIPEEDRKSIYDISDEDISGEPDKIKNSISTKNKKKIICTSDQEFSHDDLSSFEESDFKEPVLNSGGDSDWDEDFKEAVPKKKKEKKTKNKPCDKNSKKSHILGEKEVNLSSRDTFLKKDSGPGFSNTEDNSKTKKVVDSLEKQDKQNILKGKDESSIHIKNANISKDFTKEDIGINTAFKANNNVAKIASLDTSLPKSKSNIITQGSSKYSPISVRKTLSDIKQPKRLNVHPITSPRKTFKCPSFSSPNSTKPSNTPYSPTKNNPETITRPHSGTASINFGASLKLSGFKRPSIDGHVTMMSGPRRVGLSRRFVSKTKDSSLHPYLNKSKQ
ncbi:hypothetical protein AYI68_g700 [Smittium mucronatum]|uniref:Uncharacterized protein n=1 Tax=Smittium mucronatum TaxID=133383 RepID=A0A1R0H7G2_9FUNG|nr:hypothetical protein AYI68_g700 [Smittium mucronatum]